MGFSLASCFGRFSQIILIIINFIVVLLGFAVMVIGIWANLNGKNYIVIIDNHIQFTQVSVLVIVLGLFVMIVGGMGVAGGIFFSTVCGRFTLGLYGVILTLLMICEVAGGIAVAVKKGSVQIVFADSATKTFLNYTTSKDKRDAWDSFQSGFYCCGVNGTGDYAIFKTLNNSVADSCCKRTPNVICNTTDYTSDTLYQDGCVNRLIDGLNHNFDAITRGAIVVGLIKIVGIVMSCLVAVYKRPRGDDTYYEVV